MFYIFLRANIIRCVYLYNEDDDVTSVIFYCIKRVTVFVLVNALHN
jgi:hypothetical protein